MPAKPLTAAQLAEAALLKSIFKSWQQQRKGNKLPWSQDWASDQMGFGQSAMNQYLNGKIPLNPEAAAKFSALTGTNIESFSPTIAEEIVGLSVGVDAVLRFNSNIEPSAASAVPVVSWVQAGEWCDIIDNFQPGDADEWLPCPIRHGPRTYALIVRGLSMFDPTGMHSFKDGDTIFVDPDRGADHRSLVIARLDDIKEATFKQLLIEGDQRMLQALNPSWPNRIISVNGNCSICGVVIGKVESFI